MKKTIILALTVVAVLAFASAAYATTNSTYAAWSAASPNDNPATPHKGYTSATNKCAVCHAVHKAEPSGQILLRSTAGDSCVYCHVDTVTGTGILTYWIYNGSRTAYSTDTTYAPFGGGVGHNISCGSCHAVHGARTIAGSRSAKILKDWDYAPYGRPNSTFSLAKWGSAANISALGNQNDQVTAWCAGCHPYFVESYETTISYYSSPTGTTASRTGNTLRQYKSHIMTDLAGGYGNTASNLAAGTNVSWGASVYCRSCHDAGVTDGGPGVVSSSFPHYTPNRYRFMGVAPDAGTAVSDNTTGTVDGLCLKCHVNSGATAGVGMTF